MKCQSSARLSSYRTEHGAEVDLIIERCGETTALEIKATERIDESDLSGFVSFAKYYGKPHRKIAAYMGRNRLTIRDVEVLPWQDFLRDANL